MFTKINQSDILIKDSIVRICELLGNIKDGIVVMFIDMEICSQHRYYSQEFFY